jgi:hypothetical protein
MGFISHMSYMKFICHIRATYDVNEFVEYWKIRSIAVSFKSKVI